MKLFVVEKTSLNATKSVKLYITHKSNFFADGFVSKISEKFNKHWSLVVEIKGSSLLPMMMMMLSSMKQKVKIEVSSFNQNALQ